MSTIHIKETLNDNQTVTIRVDGRLDDESIVILKNVCEPYLLANTQIFLDLEGVYHIGRMGRDYLRDFRDKIKLENVN